MARTSSLNCLSYRNPHQAPHSLNASPLFTEKPFFCTEKCFVAAPSQRKGSYVTNGGLRGVWPPFLEIGRNQPFSPFCCPFRPFPEEGLFAQISSDFLEPPSLKPPFAALQIDNKWKFRAKCPGKQPKNSRNRQKTQLFLLPVPTVLRLSSRHCTRDPLGGFCSCFPAVFNVRHFGAFLDGRRDCIPRTKLVSKMLFQEGQR